MKYRMLTQWQATYTKALAIAAQDVIDADIYNLSDALGKLADALGDFEREMPADIDLLPEAKVNP